MHSVSSITPPDFALSSGRILRKLASDSRIFSGDREDAFRLITEVAAETLRTERVGIWFFSLDRQTITCQCQFELSSEQFSSGMELTAVSYPTYFDALNTERTIAADDAMRHPQTSELRESYLVPLSITSMLDTPILLDGQLIGIICHEHIGPQRVWSVEAQQFAGSMGDFVCLALEAELRCNAERALRESEGRIRSLLENIPDIVTHLDAVGTILYVNHVQPRYQHIDVIGTSAFSYVIQKHRGRLRRALHYANNRNRSSEYEVISVEGNTFQCRLVPLPPSSSAPSCMLIATDITEKIRAQEAQRQIELKMQQTQKLESLGVLAGGIAHDFNNILMGVVGNAGLILQEEDLSPALRERISLIERASKRAADLTNQLLAYSGKGNFVVGLLDLSPLVAEMLDLLKSVISKKVTLHCDLRDDLPLVDGDVTQLRQVIMNLVTNASEASGSNGGEVSIVTGYATLSREDFEDFILGAESAPGDYVFIEVSDQGCGMAPEVLSRVFDPFFTTKFSGRGLGLAAVMGIVRAHGGAVKVESKLGSGTTFTIAIPANSGDGSQLKLASIAGAATPEWRGAGLVLLVDDDELVLEVAGEMLRRSGFTLLTANSASAALQAFGTHGESVVAAVLDLSMPDVSGNELFRRLRLARPNLPIILSSGYSEQEAGDILAGEAQAVFLQKPYSPPALLGALQWLLAERC